MFGMNKETTREAKYLGRCRSCKCAVRVTAKVTVRHSIGDYGRNVADVTVVFPDGRTYRSNKSDWACFTCLCGRSVVFNRLRGRVTDHKCNVKCLASTSGVCECACGGKNHGASHDVAGAS